MKVRSVAGSLVVSLPQSVLEPVGFKEGDRVVVEAAPPRRLIVTKEGVAMTSTEHLDMEIDLLEKKKKAIESDLRYKEHQYNKNIPCEPGLEESDTAFAILMELVRDRDKLDVEIAEKRIELYNLQGGEVSPGGEMGALSVQPAETPTMRKKVDRAWYFLPQQDGQSQFLALVNAQGSCSLRRFDAQDGSAIPKGSNRRGDYRDSFSAEIKGAISLTVSKQPNLEIECKERLPMTTLEELKKQIQALHVGSAPVAQNRIFRPVNIAGKGLSDTIIRERG